MDQFVAAPGEEAPPAPAEQQAPFSASVKGDRQADIRRQEAVDPTNVEDVTDDEQGQYDDFVSRGIAMIADNRKNAEGKAPIDAMMALMNSSQYSVPQALAEGTVAVVSTIYGAAMRAGVEYSPDVLFHGADEIIAGLYLMGSGMGIFEGTPSHDWAREDMGAAGMDAQAQPPVAPAEADPAAQAPPAPADPNAFAQPPADPAAAPIPDATSGEATGMDPAALAGEEIPGEEAGPGEGDFTDEEYAIMGEAKMLAVEKFGKMLLDSGAITEKEQQEAQAFWNSQIENEVESGQVGEEMFANVDVNALRSQMTGGGK